MITAEQKQLVDAEIARCQDIAAAKFGIRVEVKHVRYDLSGTTAGKANYITRIIKLNGALMAQNFDAFLKRTVPHEYAHLVCSVVYPETVHPPIGQKRDVHGKKWQSIMALFSDDTSRCHNYDVSTVSPRNAYEVVCTECGKEYTLRQRKTPALGRYQCKCGMRDTLRFKVDVAPAPVLPSVINLRQPVVATSKIDKCKQLYAQHKDRGRAAVIEIFMDVCQIGKAHASTYYQTCKKQLG